MIFLPKERDDQRSYTDRSLVHIYKWLVKDDNHWPYFSTDSGQQKLKLGENLSLSCGQAAKYLVSFSTDRHKVMGMLKSQKRMVRGSKLTVFTHKRVSQFMVSNSLKHICFSLLYVLVGRKMLSHCREIALSRFLNEVLMWAPQPPPFRLVSDL